MTLAGAVLLFECVLVLLLAATIVLAIRLKSRIEALRRDGGGLAEALAAFDAATDRAERAAAALREAVAEAERAGLAVAAPRRGAPRA